MKNATKRRKQAAREGSSNLERDIALAQLQQRFDEENMKELDRMADILGIERCSDYVNRHLEEDRKNGLCTFQRGS